MNSRRFICGLLGWRRRYYYRLRFILDGIRRLFHLVVLKCVFTFKPNSLCKSEKLVVFFWYRQNQKGTGGADIHTIMPRSFESTFLMFKSNSLCKFEKLVVFFWCRQNQKGTGKADTYSNDLEKRVRRCTILRGVPLMYGIDGGTDFIEFRGYLVFWQ